MVQGCLRAMRLIISTRAAGSPAPVEVQHTLQSVTGGDPAQFVVQTLESYEMAALRASGKSLKAISDSLNSAGTKTRRGTEWKFQYVDAILKQALVTIAI
jgi:hypothetical protein